jgi:hypothetical protein
VIKLLEPYKLWEEMISILVNQPFTMMAVDAARFIVFTAKA